MQYAVRDSSNSLGGAIRRQERWLYEDSCSIEVWSDGSGWETVWRYGGWDNERKYKIEERVSSAPDPEYNDYNFNYFGDYHSTMWNNYTQSGGIRDSCAIFYGCWEDGGQDQMADSIDLTPYAGQTIDIRFRFRAAWRELRAPRDLSTTQDWTVSR